MFKKFFDWYEKYTEHNVIIAATLFLTQILHLLWLALFVIAIRLTGEAIWEPTSGWQTLLIILDYFEIPALIAASLLYVTMLQKRENTRRAIWYLIFLNTQWLHIFWITDEFVIDSFTGEAIHATILPSLIAWAAILVDYLEVPIMVDTSRRSIKIIKKKLAKRVSAPR